MKSQHLNPKKLLQLNRFLSQISLRNNQHHLFKRKSQLSKLKKENCSQFRRKLKKQNLKAAEIKLADLLDLIGDIKKII